MSMVKEKPATINEYIEAAAPEARAHLRLMYKILKSVAPEGTEAIKWGVPLFWDGRVIFGFAAYKAHLSFGPGSAAMQHFAVELGQYKTGKDTVQFPYNQPVPEDLIRRIASFCISEPISKDQ